MQFLTTLAALAAAFPFHAFAAPTGTSELASSSSTKSLADSYIIVLKEDTDEDAFESHQSWVMSTHANRLARRSDPTLTGLRARYVFGTFKGYTGAFDSDTVEAIRNSPEVDSIEPNGIMTASDLMIQQNAPSWGLPRISQSKLARDTSYYYDTTAGAGTTAYIVDTGINTAHSEFRGRARWGYNSADSRNDDLNGHGTHVAGTVGGATYGVAKKANLVAVKVLDASGSGNNEQIIDGIQWVVSDAEKYRRTATSVINMSLGGAYSTAVNRAVDAAVAAGITVVVAAGNEGVDATNTSPASSKSAITVGAVNKDDSCAKYSNFGRFVDVWAPGTGITSSWIGSTTATHTISGTSMAAPHVAGVAAVLLGQGGTGGDVTDEVIKLARGAKGTVKGQGGWVTYNGSGK